MTHRDAMHYGTEVRSERVEQIGLRFAVREQLDHAINVVSEADELVRLDRAARGVGLRITVTIEPAP